MSHNLYDLAKSFGGSFRLTILLIRRVKELVHGAPKLIESDSDEPFEIALEELTSGKLAIVGDESKKTEKGT